MQLRVANVTDISIPKLVTTSSGVGMPVVSAKTSVIDAGSIALTRLHTNQGTYRNRRQQCTILDPPPKFSQRRGQGRRGNETEYDWKQFYNQSKDMTPHVMMASQEFLTKIKMKEVYRQEEQRRKGQSIQASWQSGSGNGAQDKSQDISQIPSTMQAEPKVKKPKQRRRPANARRKAAADAAPGRRGHIFRRCPGPINCAVSSLTTTTHMADDRRKEERATRMQRRAENNAR